MLGFVPSPTLDLSSPSKARSRGPSHRPSLSCPAASTTSSITEITISPLTRTTIVQEYASLVYTGHCPLGMYVTPTPNNLLVWDAVFFVHQGAYLEHCQRFLYAMLSCYCVLMAVRLLHGLDPQVPNHLPCELPWATACGAVPHRCVPPFDLAAGRHVQFGTAL